MELIKKYVLILLSLLVLVPSAISLGHIFAHHDHKVCNDYEIHFHEKEIECEFLKYKPNSLFTFEIKNYSVAKAITPLQEFPETYQFLSDYQKLAFELRGPPRITV